MPREVYRCAFGGHIPFDKVPATVDLAIIAVTPLIRAFNQILVKFGDCAFKVVRRAKDRPRRTAKAPRAYAQ